MSQNKLIIGVTGGSGAGKGEVCRVLADFGAQILDADKIAHSVIKKGATPAYDEILAVFGNQILGAGNEINRKILGDIVFADKGKLAQLSQIVHKHVIYAINKAVKTSDNSVIAIDAPVLVEAGVDKMCHAVIGVFAPHEMRINRIIARDGLTRKSALARINSQMPDAELARHITHKVDNDGDFQHLYNQITKITRVIL
ncbi:MAG: dephospho-CoA kinase [Defluviitaleaceae bacterium]|nr:dephospho-CoA kinase [Defluviitaleaceae bacterium]